MAIPPFSERGIYFQNPDQTQGEPSLKPKWIELHKEMFPEGSLGFALFPEILEGRKRPETILNQPLTSLFRVLKLEGLLMFDPTIADFLHTSNEKFSQSLVRHSGARVMKNRLEEFLQNLAITPHAKLLEKIFDRPQYPVPPEREQEIIDVVEEKLKTLTARKQRVLSLRFGLVDGIIQPLEKVGREYGVTKERVRQLEAEALRNLHHPSIGRELKQHLSLPTNSFGRQIFGAVFMKDLPALDFDPRSLSDSTYQELEKDILQKDIIIATYGLDVNLLETLLRADLEKHSLSPVARAEITERLEVAKLARSQTVVPILKAFMNLSTSLNHSEEQK